MWVRDINDPTSDVGVEVAFDMVVQFDLDDGTSVRYRFVGKIDGVHTEPKFDNRVVLQENKTTARIDDAWKNSFQMAHQPTGYMLALSLWCGLHVDKFYLLGLQLPLPRTISEGIYLNRHSREPWMMTHWFNWFYHTATLISQYQDDPINAPRYTHSCNRYFRSCSFLPFCTADDAEKLQIMDEMEIDKWSPLDD